VSSNTISATVAKRIVVARHLFHMASEQARANRGVSSFAAINLLQDASEVFLVAAAECLSIKVAERINFAELFDEVEQKSPGSAAFRAGMMRANRMRVLSKHHAVQPDRSGVEETIALTRQFLTDTCDRILSRSFWSLSLLDEIEDREVRDLLEQAEVSFGAGDYVKALIRCRCAFYLVFEQRYDAGPFLRNDKGDAAWNFLDFSVPPECRDYILEPFDYIRLDYIRIERDLIADLIDPTVFRNVMSLTPAVYRYQSKWLVRKDARTLDADSLPARASYALEHTAEMILRRQARLDAEKNGPSGDVGKLRLRDREAMIYRKATKHSEVIGPARLLSEPIRADASIPTLDGEKFLRIIYSPSGVLGNPAFGIMHCGYLHADAVEFVTDDTAQEGSSPKELSG
jgi:hypothetical protein